MNFNLDLILNILLIVVFLGFLTWLWYKGKKDTVAKIILSLIIQAEKEFGSGTGQLKYNYVLGEAYKLLPSLLKIFLTEKKLNTLIDDGVLKLKELLESVKQKTPEVVKTDDSKINIEKG